MNLTATIVINRPAADVFDYVMEVPHDAQWRSGVVEASFTSDGPIGVGTTGFDRDPLERGNGARYRSAAALLDRSW